MECIKYSEEQILVFALQNSQNVELLEILINDFGLNVNWRTERFYDTLLYQSLKGSNERAAEFLISKGACINASLGGYPKKDTDHGPYSILDVASGFNSISEVGGRKWLVDRGAVSYEKLPKEIKTQFIEKMDKTTVAKRDKYITKSYDQAKLSIAQSPDYAYEQLKDFVSGCSRVEIDVSNELRR